MRETAYQRKLIDKLYDMFYGCIILKNDSSYMQGVPDIIILYDNTWAMLEVKLGSSSNVQPNQIFYINRFNKMSFASFINPDTEQEVLDELQRTFSFGR